MRVKVQFQDEDELVTQWIDVVAKSSTGVSTFQMPGEKDEVWCAVDAKGEGGCLIGSRYNAKDAPPSDNNDMTAITFPGGSIIIDTGSGALTLTLSADLNIKAANIILESGSLTHNGKNIGSDHGHVSAPSGPPGPPV